MLRHDTWKSVRQARHAPFDSENVVMLAQTQRRDLKYNTINAKIGTFSMGIPVNTPDRPLMAPDTRSTICC